MNPAENAAASAAFPTTDQLAVALKEGLSPQWLQVIDDSHLHAGHAGAKEGRHFTVRVASELFRGRPRIARHRLVYDALSAWVGHGIHALAIDARLPEEAPSDGQAE